MSSLKFVILSNHQAILNKSGEGKWSDVLDN